MLPLDVICKEVTFDPNVSVRNVEVRPEESDEESNHLRICVRETHLIRRALSALTPVQHAAQDVELFPSTGNRTAVLLGSPPNCSIPLRNGARATALPVVGGVHYAKLRMLVVGEFDVAHPQANRRLSNSQPPRDLVDWKSFFAA
jgi:hypothetical protein